MTNTTDPQDLWLRLAAQDAVTSVQELPGGIKVYSMSITLHCDDQ